MPNTSCPQQWQLRSLRRERVVGAETTERRPWQQRADLGSFVLSTCFTAGMEILSILAVEEGRLKVQLDFSVQQLPKHHSAPLGRKLATYGLCLPQLLFGCNA